MSEFKGLFIKRLSCKKKPGYRYLGNPAVFTGARPVAFRPLLTKGLAFSKTAEVF
jgi:hypothetical protein